MEPQTPHVIELGGRRFVPPAFTTVDLDFWIMREIREAGLDLIDVASMGNVQAAVDGILNVAIASGKVTTLLGGLLLPEGLEPKDWTPAIAAETTAHLGRLIDPKDKTQIRPLVASMLIGFFSNGLASLLTSQKSSTGANEPSPEAGSDLSEEPSTSETGPI